MLPAAGALAADSTPPRHNSVEFQAEAQREVQNDLVNASLYVELNDANPAALADAINKSVNEALRVAKGHQSARTRSDRAQSRGRSEQGYGYGYGYGYGDGDGDGDGGH